MFFTSPQMRNSLKISIYWIRWCCSLICMKSDLWLSGMFSPAGEVSPTQPFQKSELSIQSSQCRGYSLANCGRTDVWVFGPSVDWRQQWLATAAFLVLMKWPKHKKSHPSILEPSVRALIEYTRGFCKYLAWTWDRRSPLFCPFFLSIPRTVLSFRRVAVASNKQRKHWLSRHHFTNGAADKTLHFIIIKIIFIYRKLTKIQRRQIQLLNKIKSILTLP